TTPRSLAPCRLAGGPPVLPGAGLRWSPRLPASGLPGHPLGPCRLWCLGSSFWRAGFGWGLGTGSGYLAGLGWPGAQFFATTRRDGWFFLGHLLGGFGARFQVGWGEDLVGPLLEALFLVGQVEHAVLGVFELGAPEQGVERADLHADPAVHAQRVVDGEPVEHLDRAGPASAGRRVGLLVGFDVDAPVGTLPRALPADGAVLLLQGDHPAGPGREVRLLVRVLLGDGGLEHVLQRDPEALDQPEPGRRPPLLPLGRRPDFLFGLDGHLLHR